MNDKNLKYMNMENIDFFPCPCCDYLTISEKNRWEICPICFWEDDMFQHKDPNLKGGANDMSLIEARKKFKKFGAKDESRLKYVRKPFDYEIP